ncbi:MAG: hypothetical protein RQ761_00950 [Bacteroidales bacterium]|nr:hypothetical protein [Bacteroidales bacterium]
MRDPEPLPNFLIVSGNGRDSGKTGFITRLIRQTAQQQKITAIKVSPHLHPGSNPNGLLLKTDHYILAKEIIKGNRKDSARMLEAGAHEVYYIEATDEHLPEAFETFRKLIPVKGPVVCESGGLRDIINPSLFIMINRNDGRPDKKGFVQRLPLADLLIVFNGHDYDLHAERIRFDGSSWKYQNE